MSLGQSISMQNAGIIQKMAEDIVDISLNGTSCSIQVNSCMPMLEFRVDPIVVGN